jgi:hypothetical protein
MQRPAVAAGMQSSGQAEEDTPAAAAAAAAAAASAGLQLQPSNVLEPQVQGQGAGHAARDIRSTSMSQSRRRHSVRSSRRGRSSSRQFKAKRRRGSSHKARDGRVQNTRSSSTRRRSSRQDFSRSPSRSRDRSSVRNQPVSRATHMQHAHHSAHMHGSSSAAVQLQPARHAWPAGNSSDGGGGRWGDAAGYELGGVWACSSPQAAVVAVAAHERWQLDGCGDDW